MAFKRWMYRGGRPNGLTRLINLGWAVIHALGIMPDYLVTLEVVGRQSGKMIRFPLVMTILHGERCAILRRQAEMPSCGTESASRSFWNRWTPARAHPF